jgi:hypothetical protein
MGGRRRATEKIGYLFVPEELTMEEWIAEGWADR